jgi:hypothetical protein
MIFIEQIKEIYLGLNDTYLLQNIDKTIIINNGYVGISLLDKNFQQFTNLFIYDSLCIDWLYKLHNNNIIMYSSEDQHLISANITTLSYTIVSLQHINTTTIYPIYAIKGNQIVIACNKPEFLHIDFSTRKVTPIGDQETMISYPTVYTLWDTAKHYGRIYSVDQCNATFIYKDYENRDIGFCNTLSGDIVHAHSYDEYAHGFLYYNGNFVFISKHTIKCMKEDSILFNLSAHSGRIFKRACFFPTHAPRYLVALSANETDYQDTKLEIYQLNNM